MAVWLCSYVAMWLYGYVAMWLCGYVAMWLCGCVAMWLSGYTGCPFTNQHTDSHPCIRIGGPVDCIGGPESPWTASPWTAGPWCTPGTSSA